jgi:RNA polymerase sigma-70 factor (ECF subfamily)
MESSGMVADIANQFDVQGYDKNFREFEAALSRYLPTLHRIAFRYLGNGADAEDAVQDALLSAYRHLGQFRGEAQMSSWLMSILINSARVQMRRRPRQRRISLDDQSWGSQSSSILECLSDRRPGPEQIYRGAELVQHLLQLALRLPPSLRRAFELRDLEGLSIREITDRLGVTEGAAKSQISRARARLRGLMRKRHAGTSECDMDARGHRSHLWRELRRKSEEGDG